MWDIKYDLVYRVEIYFLKGGLVITYGGIDSGDDWVLGTHG